jgi:hypothetical protein
MRAWNSVCATLIFIQGVVNLNHFSAGNQTRKRFLRYNWSVVAFWGIMARGAIAVPVDFMSGRDRGEPLRP